MLTCVCMSLNWQAMGTSLESIRTGRGVEVVGGWVGDGQRDDEEEGEEMGSFP